MFIYEKYAYILHIKKYQLHNQNNSIFFLTSRNDARLVCNVFNISIQFLLTSRSIHGTMDI